MLKTRLSFLFGLFVLFNVLMAVGYGQQQLPAVADTTADEAAVRQLTADYFATYPRRDLDAMMAFWSTKAPTFDSRKKLMQTRIAERDKIQLSNFTLRHMNVDGDKAFARVEFEMSANLISTGKPVPNLGWSTSTIRLIKEEGQWKIWAHEDGFDVLAQELLAAKIPEARDQMWETEHQEFAIYVIYAMYTTAPKLIKESKYQEAHEALDFALKLGDRYNIQNYTIYLLSESADVYRHEGNFTLALEQVERARMLAEQGKDKLALLVAYEYTGFVYFALGEPVDATEYFQKAYNLKDEAKVSNVKIAEIVDALGASAYLACNYGKALELYQKGAEWRKEPEGLMGQGAPWNNIGAVYEMTGDYDLALKFLNMSLDYNLKHNNREMASMALGNIGTLYHMRDQYDEALKYFQQSLSFAEEVQAKPRIAGALQGISNQYEEMGNYETAQEYLERALKLSEEIGHHGLTASIITNMAGLLIKEGKFTEAIATAQHGAELSGKILDRVDLTSAYTIEGEAYFKLKQFPEAQRAYNEAIENIESMRKDFASPDEQRQHFLESKLDAYISMVDLLATEGKSEEALKMAERAKARVLLDVLENGHSNTSRVLTLAERTQEDHYLNVLKSLNMQLQNALQDSNPNSTEVEKLKSDVQKARLDREAFQTALYVAHPELKVRRGEVDPFDIKKAATLIPDSKTAIVEFVVMAAKTYVFVLSKENSSGSQDSLPGIKVYTIQLAQKDLAKLVNDYRDRIARRDLSFKDPAGKLFKQLLQPAEAQLSGKTKLIIVPDGPLWELPFQALITTNGHYLIERSAIAYEPSISVLYQMEQKKRDADPNLSKGKLLAYGNPAIGQDTISRLNLTLRDERLTPLPEAEVEVNSVAKIYGTKQSKVSVGPDADEAKFKADAGQYKILHLATHGILNNYSAMYSHIVLSKDEKGEEDGLLEAWEIMNLDLKADLVVLSACETARGKYGAGEGIIGLSWALFVAGAPTSVVSQWKIESASTTQLMVSFHNELTASGANGKPLFTKAEALQKADLKLLEGKQYQHPFYWAGFVVMGDGFQPLR